RLAPLPEEALRPAPEEANFGGVWQRLAERVGGPFGGAALESPALSSLEAELLASGGSAQATPFVLSERAVHKPLNCLLEVLHFNSISRARSGSLLQLI